ncbi:hypothetical protein KIPE111705_27085 [Kibdelosporangium persicum]|uniref:Uncharacterized protein n=1 Tax=Kibdelosporangium persicum TaxID=2698649 RepID=A0ABX2EW55_9PSEU|nr:hypothetical protein [Kibdelosporangium persicum]NRN63263.1 hypothetical protein [Kibdelosporangium persicum]
MPEEVTVAEFTTLLRKLDKFSESLPEKERDLFCGLVYGATTAIMDGFRAYADQFSSAFKAGKTTLSLSYDEETVDGRCFGKHVDMHVKPGYIKP